MFTTLCATEVETTFPPQLKIKGEIVHVNHVVGAAFFFLYLPTSTGV